MCPVGGHGVGACNGAESYGTLVGSFVSHHSDALHGEEDCACLPHFVIEIPVAEALDEYVVGFLEDAHFLGGDVAKDAHCESGTGERVAIYEMLRHAEFAAHVAHFVFKEQTERLAEFEVHFLGEASHIVVAFDDGAGDRERLNAVGVDSSLGEPFHIFYFMGFFVEDIDEALADNLAFAFRLGDAGEFGEEFFACIDADYVQTQALIVAQHVFELVFAKHTVVDENAGEIVADSAVEEHGSHRRSAAATKS